MTANALEPVRTGERIDSIDVLRGVAVLGILLMNIIVFGLPFSAVTNPTLVGTFEGPDLTAFRLMLIAVEGSQRTIFSMLFGAGVVLLTTRHQDGPTPIAVADIYYRRTIWLVLFGLIDAYVLLWFGDILYLYGMAGLFLFTLRNSPPRRLFIGGCTILVLLALQNAGLSLSIAKLTPIVTEAQEILAAGGDLSQGQREAIETMAELPGYRPLPEELAAEIEARGGGYFTALAHTAPIALSLQTEIALLRLFWDALAMMLLGMALFKWRVFDASRSVSFYAVMTGAGLAIGISVNGWETTQVIENGFPSSLFFPTYDIGRLGCGIGYIGLVMLFCRLEIVLWLRNALAATGRMALTNYIMQTIICNIVFVGFGLFGQLRFHELYYVVAGVWLFQLVVSPVWLSRYRFGPLEWVWRSLTYKKKQPLRIVVEPAAQTV